MRLILLFSIFLLSLVMHARVPVLVPSAEIWLGSGRGYQGGYETLGGFLALYDEPCRNYPFVDVLLHSVHHKDFASNVGIGWRSFSPCFEEMFGLNLFYDYRHVRRGSLHQMGLGMELLGRFWALRANGYLPFARRHRVLYESETFDYVGGAFARVDKFNAALRGFDFEVGCKLRFPCISNLFVGIGPYYYQRGYYRHNLLGGMARIQTYFLRYFSAELFVTHDDHYATKVQGVLRVFVPFTCLRCPCLNHFEKVWRNEIITTDRLCCWTTNF